MKTLLALIFLCAAHVQGQVLLYKRTIHSVSMGHGFTTKKSVTGCLIVDAETGAAVEFDIYSKAKEFLARGRTFTTNTVRGGFGKDYLVLAEAVADSDNFGPYRLSSTAKGLSVPLNIGLADTRSVPRTMRFVGRYISRLGTESFIDEQSGTLVIDLPATQNANSAGKTLDEVVAAFRSDLLSQGYRDIHP
jgi:hypothetical protein